MRQQPAAGVVMGVVGSGNICTGNHFAFFVTGSFAVVCTVKDIQFEFEFISVTQNVTCPLVMSTDQKCPAVDPVGVGEPALEKIEVAGFT
jgi:hypothetical protein